MSSTADYLSTGQAALRLRCLPWQLHRLWDRGLLPEPRRYGRYKLIDPADLPQIRRALEEAGYLPAEVAD
jgi:DNA-binding transcriptional MerR regulator